ncbi:MAG: outer membrane assembly lipoprotein [Gallionellaceae bacterium]|nr:MAG: outer membrane assembly lipoprotein [Gallionellaceae bacterium]
MKLSRGIAISLLTVFAAGCSSDKEQASPASLVNFKSSAKYEVRWKQSVGKMGDNILLPAVTPESVFAANSNGVVQRFDRSKGRRLWRIDSGFVISGGVGAGDGLVLVGGQKGEVAAFEESAGQLRWKSKVSSEVLSAPKLVDGVVVVRTGDGRIAGLDSQDGKRLWLYERATPALVARSNAGVTIHNRIVYAGFPAGKLAAIGLHNGVIVWEASVSQPRGNTELERVSDITSLPIVDDSQVCAVAFQGRLACFDAERGGSLWTRDLSSDKGLTMSRKYLFLTDTAGTVLALDKLSGSSYWKNDQMSLRKTTAALALDNYLVVADYEGYLHALNRDDGSFAARFMTDGSTIRSAPVATDDGFVVQTSGGGLYSIVIH